MASGPIGCPRCGRTQVARSARRKALERLLSAIGVYPYRCQLCRHRFRAFRRGTDEEPMDRREYERLPASAPVTLMWNDGEAGGLLSELSIAGATVETDAPLAVGDALQLTFKATGEDVEVSVDVSLVRSTRPGEVGVEFTGIKSEQQQRLERLVLDLLERLRRP